VEGNLKKRNLKENKITGFKYVESCARGKA